MYLDGKEKVEGNEDEKWLQRLRRKLWEKY